MQIFVKLPTGKNLTINVQSSESIDDVKTKVQTSTGIAPERQRLIFAGKDLQSGTTLADGNVADGSTMDLVVRIFGGAGNIVCQREAGNVVVSIRIAVDDDTTVKTVKDDIRNSLEQSLGVKPKQVMLSYRGDNLRSVNTLQHYNIQYGETLSFSLGRRH
ncbi:Ubiquitin [Annulohypoxylon maeteangense]|uniref:Ubiquitin n=1 Tax=Annulohypoxylon maeteangense TaxID=1927788 RepID=UPI002007837A|nr:Ubiquitin [Annulohypoxylon maeteangense]KAI0886198.1 Ubiquitin [Annulohypoxylon maeteangense]